MLAVGSDVVVELGDVPVFRIVRGSVENVAGSVERIPQLRLVRKRVLAHVFKNSRVGAMGGTTRGDHIHGSNGFRRLRRTYRRRDRKIAGGGGVGSAADTLHGIAGTVRTSGTEILDDAVAHRRSRHNLGLADRFRVAIAFVIQKEEKTVLEDRAAERRPKN